MSRTAAELGAALLDLVFPPHCQLCGAYGEAFCGPCRSRIEPALNLPLPRDLAGAVSVGLHAGPLREAVLRLKFGGRLSLVAPLGGLLGATLREPQAAWRAEVVVPVPAHWWRRFERGFNQSELLAREVARGLALPLAARALVRAAYRRPQVGLSGQRRPANVAAAFRIGRPAVVAGRRVLLVDDVRTTGATLSACAAALRAGGAAAIYAATLTSEPLLEATTG
jgi:ComF family protein